MIGTRIVTRIGTWDGTDEAVEVHEKLFTELTGVPCVWRPEGIACDVCDGEGDVLWQMPLDSRDPTAGCDEVRVPCDGPRCEDGALGCTVCGDRLATLQLTAPDGEVFEICETSRCWEFVREWVQPKEEG